MVSPGSSRARVRCALVTVVTATLGATLFAPPAVAAPAEGSAATIGWAECRDGFECAQVPVPLDHDEPQGEQIGLSVIRLPAGDPSQRLGSLMLNPGGPGGSGVEFVRQVGKFMPLELRARFDIVGFDPRGINLSTPLRCFATFDEALSVLPPFAFPDTPEEEQTLRESDDRLSAACAESGGAVRDQMSSADVARDMDLLREAFGDDEVNFLGFSYGSVLGQNYANLFPERVGAFVIDGVVDPIAWSTGYGQDAASTPVASRIGSAAGAQATLDEFFRLCDAAGTDCAFSGNSGARFAALVDRLRAQPLIVTDPVTGEQFTVTYNDVIALTLGVLYAPVIWPDVAFFFADLEQQVSPAALGLRLAGIRSGLGLAPAAQEQYPNFVEGSPGVTCSDSVNPRSFEAYQAAADEAEARDGRFGRIWNWTWSSCLSWPTTAGEDRYLGPWTAETATPVLVVGNRFDPATPYSGAVAAADLLPGSRLLTYAGWGHTAFFSAGNYCVDSIVTRYLVTGELPEDGTVCQPEGSPFGPASPEAGSSAAQVGAALHESAVPDAVRRALNAA
jgi:pimeloyl-ACP methyl ester carboxylesterase